MRWIRRNLTPFGQIWLAVAVAAAVTAIMFMANP